MASNPYFTSLIWLVSLGGVGYGLLRLTEPSAEKLEKIRASGAATHLTDDEQKKLLFMKRLKEAAAIETPPVYMPTKRN